VAVSAFDIKSRLRRTLVGCVAAFLSISALAADPRSTEKKSAAHVTPAIQVVKSIYERHQPGVGRDLDFDDPRETSAFMSAELSALIAGMQACEQKQQDFLGLGADPIYDAQDMQDEKIAVQVWEGKRPNEVVASFTVLRRPTQVRFDMVETKSGWRIANIRHGERSVRDILQFGIDNHCRGIPGTSPGLSKPSGTSQVEAYDLERGRRYLQIVHKSPEKIDFCLDLVEGRTAHLCTVNGSAQREEGGFLYKDGLCELTLNKSDRAWTVEENGACSRSRCGANAQIRRRQFPLSSRTAKARPCMAEDSSEGEAE
jgi:hypothetical protein